MNKQIVTFYETVQRALGYFENAIDEVQANKNYLYNMCDSWGVREYIENYNKDNENLIDPTKNIIKDFDKVKEQMGEEINHTLIALKDACLLLGIKPATDNLEEVKQVLF